MFIYLIVNHITGKYYIGQHKGNNLKKYLQKKIYDAANNRGGSSRLFRSIRKHGRDAFTIHALLSNIQTRVELDQCEKDFISFLKSQDPEYGYNICRGGEGNTSTMSEETKTKLKSVGNPVFSRTPEQEARRLASLEQARHEQGGSFLTAESIEKIKAARAVQDESTRIAGVRKYAEEHPEEMSTRMSREVHALGGKAGSREAKQRAARASIQSGSIVKAQHTRWHVNRGQVNPECPLC